MDNNIQLKLHTDISNTDISNHDKFIVINIPNENIEITQDNYNNFNNDNSLELNSTTRPTRNLVYVVIQVILPLKIVIIMKLKKIAINLYDHMKLISIKNIKRFYIIKNYLLMMFKNK